MSTTAVLPSVLPMKTAVPTRLRRIPRFAAPALLLALVAGLLPGRPGPIIAQELSPGEALALLRTAEASAAREDVAQALEQLAARHGTPLYVYDRQSIAGQFRALEAAFRETFGRVRVLYALKANSNPSIIRLLHEQGAGAETVSGGEILLALRAGMQGEKIIFTSSSKSPDELELAARENVLVNVDSTDELHQLAALSARLQKPIRIAIRVNPAVDPDTIHQINTGKAESKFGIHLADGLARDAFRQALQLDGFRVCGLHCHIGSQITSPEAYVEAARKVLDFAVELRKVLGLTLEFIDLGGGFGVPYRDDQTVMTPAELAAALKPVWETGVSRLGYRPDLWIEPGRFLVAPSGVLLCRVNSVKRTPLRTFVNVDAGFNTLARPAMYGAFHRVRVIGREGPEVSVDIAGNVCETGDILATDRKLPLPGAGGLIAILDAGAYGFAMASEYNSRPLPAEVLVEGKQETVIRRRGTWEDLLRSVPSGD